MHAPITSTTRLPIGSDADLAWVRQQVRQTTADLGFNLVQQTKLVTAASELARNALVHGGGGYMEMTVLTKAPTADCGCPSSMRAPASGTSSSP